jgi:hypothetical protein
LLHVGLGQLVAAVELADLKWVGCDSWADSGHSECRAQSQRDELMFFHDESPLKGELIIMTSGLWVIRHRFRIGYKVIYLISSVTFLARLTN